MVCGFFLIYLEIIELNFCGLSTNIKRNIISKGENESNQLNNDKKEAIDEEEDDEGDNQPIIKTIEIEMVEKKDTNNIY